MHAVNELSKFEMQKYRLLWVQHLFTLFYYCAMNLFEDAMPPLQLYKAAIKLNLKSVCNCETLFVLLCSLLVF